MTENQKEVMITKLRAEKSEYDHFKLDFQDLQLKMSLIQEKMRQLNKEKVNLNFFIFYYLLKELREIENSKINDVNYKEIATFKTEITLTKNEIMIMEDELKEVQEKTKTLVQMNQGQDVFLDELRENFREIQSEQVKINEEKDLIDQEVN